MSVGNGIAWSVGMSSVGTKVLFFGVGVGRFVEVRIVNFVVDLCFDFVVSCAFRGARLAARFSPGIGSGFFFLRPGTRAQQHGQYCRQQITVHRRSFVASSLFDRGRG